MSAPEQKGGAPHPATVPVALIVADIVNRKIKGTPRQIAEKIINAVFEGEAERWAESHDVWIGGNIDEDGDIDETGSQIEGTHHRRMLVFFSEWEEGSPRVKNSHPLTGEVIYPPATVAPATAATAAEALRRFFEGMQVDEKFLEGLEK